jgi:hypothetical protein
VHAVFRSVKARTVMEGVWLHRSEFIHVPATSHRITTSKGA